jgi:hypothetical protein
MSESAGSCAVYRQTNVLDTLKNSYEKRQLVKRELRKANLAQKGKEGSLNANEKLELTGYRIQDGLEKLAAMQPHTVCYLA